MVGSTLSHYRIDAELGRGGMGVVYRALDERLGREVAVKVLPKHAIGVGDEAARFAREARAAAALNHPRIATVHEIDEEDGQSFIVMEYVDGPSLKDRIREGPLPLDDTLRLAIQVADGLSAAHERGIVHRDMKPANVMLTAKGDAKIMDFGLAQLTDVTQLTQTGATLGTVTYMSPEQARGEKVDVRSDVFSLGVVLYEMVLGQPAFRGAYAEAIVYAILNEDPQPLTALRTGVPMELERIVSKCLAKEPAERYQGMQDLLVDLRALEKALPELGGSGASATRTRPTETRLATNSWVPWGVAGTAVVLVVAVLWFGNPDSGLENVSSFVTTFPIPDGYGLMPDNQAGKGSGIALSRDGSWLAFIAYRDGVSKLFLKGPEDFESREIPESEGADVPFFSPDGEWLGFTRDNERLMKVSTRGGNPVSLLVDTPWIFGAAWTTDGQIVYWDNIAALKAIPDEGGEPSWFGPMDSTRQRAGMWPVLLPRDRRVLGTYPRPGVRGGIEMGLRMLDVRTGSVTDVIRNGAMAQHIDDGNILFLRRGGLWDARIDLESGEVLRSPRLVQSGLSIHVGTGYPTTSFGVAENGTIALVRGVDLTALGSRILRVDIPTGTADTLFDARQFTNVSVSPDGRRVVAEALGSIWMGEIDRNVMNRIETDGAFSRLPIWYNGGRSIAYTDYKADPGAPLMKIGTDGDRSGDTLRTDWAWPSDWSDRHRMFVGEGLRIFPERQRDGEAELWLDSTPAMNRQATFSPDGEFIAYSSNRSGRFEVYAVKYPEKSPEYLVSANGGVEPLWSPDGEAIYYRDESGARVFRASFDARAASPIGPSEFVMEGRFAIGMGQPAWDISADGRYFFLIENPERPAPPDRISLVYNWRPATDR